MPRKAPDAAVYVRRAISSRVPVHCAGTLFCPAKPLWRSHFRPRRSASNPTAPDACIVTAGADDPEAMVPWLAMPGCEFEVLEPPEVVAAVRVVAERLARAAR